MLGYIAPVLILFGPICLFTWFMIRREDRHPEQKRKIYIGPLSDKEFRGPGGL
jgi:preprotein translocase subunit YajC